jgi:colicin import membrane protein
MKRYLIAWSVMFCTVAWSEEITVAADAEFPSEMERSAERTRLTIARQQLEDQYKKEIKLCYQNFDVTSCRIQARDRRIESNTALRQQELRFNAQERLIHAEETRRSIADRNSEATMKEAEAQRAAAISASKDRADANAQKQIDHALQGTKRGEYEQRLREAAQHKVDLEKKLRERNKEPAAPLPVPSK